VFEAVNQLWQFAKGNKTALETGFQSYWLVGGLQYRLSYSTSVSGSDSHNYTCASMNLTQPVHEPLLPDSFQCNAINAFWFPFSMTGEQALEQATVLQTGDNWGIEQFTAVKIVNLAVIMQFPMYNPNNDIFSWVTVSLASSKYGGLIQRVQALTFDRRLQTPIIVLVSLHLAVLVCRCIIAFVFRDQPRRLDFIIGIVVETLHVGIGVAALACVLRVTYPAVRDLAQGSYIPAGFDTSAYYYTWAQHLFAIWSIFTILSLFRYFPLFPYLSKIHRVVKLMLPDLWWQFIVFSFGYVVFLCIAVVVFGSSTPELSSIGPANAILFTVLFGNLEAEVFVRNFPLAGMVFYYVFRAYVSFLVINFLTTTVLSPIPTVRSEDALAINVVEASRADARTWSARIVARLRMIAVWVIHVARASIGYRLCYWLRLNRALQRLMNNGNTAGQVDGAADLIDLLTSSKSPHLTGNLFATVTRLEMANCLVSFSMAKLIIARESPNSMCRDAMFLQLVRTYHKMTKELQPIVEMPEEDEDAASPGILRDDENIDKITHKTVVCRDGRSVEFYFTRQVVDLFLGATFGAPRIGVLLAGIRRLAVVAGFLLLITAVGQSTRPLTFLSQNLRKGLHLQPIRESCTDSDCTETSGFTRAFTFDQVGEIEDLRDFLLRGYSRLVVDSESVEEGFAFPDQSSWFVEWDNFAMAHGKVTWRQLRGAPVPCASYPPNTTGLPQTCYSDTIFDTSPFQPENLNEVFEYRNSCVERSPPARSPFGRIFPCAGHSVQFNTTQRLNELVAHWIDNATRLLALSVVIKAWSGVDLIVSKAFLNSTDEISIEYNMYIEMSHGGASALVWTYTEPLSDPSMTVMALRFSIAMLIVAGAFVAEWLARHIMNRRLLLDEFIPNPTIALYVLYFGLYAAPDYFAFNASASSIAIIMLIQQMTFEVCIPFVEIFFRRATSAKYFLVLALQSLLPLLPVFVLFVVGFATAGRLMFGSWLDNFAATSRAMETVSLAFLGDFSFRELYIREPHISFLYSAILQIVVVLIALNLLLAYIGGAAKEAESSTAFLAGVEQLASEMNQWIIFGPIVPVIARWYIARGSPVDDEDLRVVSGDTARMPLLLELLCHHLRPRIAEEILREIHFALIPVWLRPSAIGAILSELHRFRREHQELYLEDIELVGAASAAGDDDQPLGATAEKSFTVPPISTAETAVDDNPLPTAFADPVVLDPVVRYQALED